MNNREPATRGATAEGNGRGTGFCFPVSGSRFPVAQRGYTLIEVIVAFALLAAALTLLLGSLSGAARQVRNSADAGRAALHAQSLMAQVGVGVPVKPGSRNGELDNGRYRWALQVQRWDDPARRADLPFDPAAPTLLEVRLGIEWGDGGPGQRLLLRTLRIVPPGVDTGG
ncbi:type II secretion system protein XpsI [Lysobacter solisilvae (ex Woo and Kim 2020)]|uniref:Prepilin-type N-terminal cleavage/methylation domain-containing protein n=1 Tax=Agrilutibacter terrestris TaxID=2865112 RepID=A0A7H0FZC0_9GAMM|nr:prepilin-type N-terminal cleavage/methylation domain-containing protein [Lysobacter terrestris]QNP41386.1 prepilin-type N-terminal cleavage/methylation domain-containing protein [Lysobacter terrestris]